MPRYQFTKHEHNFRLYINNVQIELLRLKGSQVQVKQLASKIVDDLLKITKYSKNNVFISLDENGIRVITFAHDLDTHIDQTVSLLDQLIKHDFNGIKNQGYFEPHDKQLSTQIRNEMVAIKRSLVGIQTMLTQLFELEKEVEKLTTKYLDRDSES